MLTNMAIDPSYFGPYLSFGLLVAESDRRSLDTLTTEIQAAVFADRPSSEQGAPRTLHRVGKFSVAALSGRGFVYRVRETPSWWRDPVAPPVGARRAQPPVGEAVHLVLVVRHGRWIAVYTSHPSDWGRVLRAVEDGRVSKVAPVPAETINGAFTDSDWPMPSVWMKGLHNPVQTKADSKQLTGLNVRSVIDQFGDQTYHFSSGRSRVPVDDDQHEFIGLSPARHRIWLGQSADFAQFCNRTEWVLTALSSASAVNAPIAELAQPLMSLNTLGLPDEIGWAPHGEHDSWTPEVAQAVPVLERVSLDLDPSLSVVGVDGGTGDRTVHTTLRVLDQGVSVAAVKLDIRYPNGSNTVGLHVVPGDPADATDYERAVHTIFVDAGWGTIRYPDGHVVAGRVAYLPHYSAVPFTGWEWFDFSVSRPVNVTKEKPTFVNAAGTSSADLSQIGATGEDSLFSWAHDRWGTGRFGLLLCDDGAGEIADFLHLAPRDQDGWSLLTFVHAKGGKSKKGDRQLSVTAYEVVVAQAVKNLAYSEPDTVAEKLRTLSATARVWKDGVPDSDASGFADELLSRGQKVRRRIVVLNPQTVKAQYEIDTAAASPSLRARHAQLSTLLLEAEAACRSVGAQFSVFSAER